MTSPGQVLIVDDDPDFVAIYREMLEEQGLGVMVAHTAEDGIRTLERSGRDLDVVLLDQKLRGPGGPDSGLELIARSDALAPFAKTIVVTAYATDDAVGRAFELGAYDYLVKNGAFSALLRAKIRNAVEITSERRLAALSHDETVAGLSNLWTRARDETDRNRKGRLLEELVKLLFRATPGFERVETRLKNEVEELDIVVENRASHAPWTAEGAPYLLGECKNWSSSCGAPEFRNFHAKLTTKFGRAKVGFFFAPGGFTSAFHAERTTRRQSDVLVIPVDAADLERWIDAEERVEVLRALHKRAVFELR